MFYVLLPSCEDISMWRCIFSTETYNLTNPLPCSHDTKSQRKILLKTSNYYLQHQSLIFVLNNHNIAGTCLKLFVLSPICSVL